MRITQAADYDESRLLAALLDSSHDCSVVVDRPWRAYWEFRYSDPLIDSENLRINGVGRITEIGSPVADAREIDARYVGLMRFRGRSIGALASAHAALGSVPRPWMDERPVDDYEKTLALLARGNLARFYDPASLQAPAA